MKLLEQLKQRAHDRAEDDRVDFGKTWSEYRLLLTRADNPEPGDVDRLVELADQLDISEDEVAVHQLAVSESRRLESKIVDAPNVRSRSTKLGKDVERASEACREARAKLGELATEHQKLREQLARLDGIETQLVHLRLSFPRLLMGRDRSDITADDVPGHLLGCLPPTGIVRFARARGVELPRVGAA